MKKTTLVFVSALMLSDSGSLWAVDYLPLKDEWKADTLGYQDEKGNVLIKPQFYKVLEFSDGIGIVQQGLYYISTKI